MLHDGSYKEARELRPGIDRLMLQDQKGVLASNKPVSNKVRSVISVRLAYPVSVYDLEVDSWSNFVLSSGAIVHNSKDCSDALAGCLYTLLTRRAHAPLPMLKGLSMYGDAWLPEQRQAALAGDRLATLNNDYSDYGMLPPFLTGTGEGNR
jgi:hypothetical protein